MNYAIPANTGPQATTSDHACGVLDRVLALAYGVFFVVLAVAGSLWIVADLSAALMPGNHVH